MVCKGGVIWNIFLYIIYLITDILLYCGLKMWDMDKLWHVTPMTFHIILQRAKKDINANSINRFYYHSFKKKNQIHFMYLMSNTVHSFLYMIYNASWNLLQICCCFLFTLSMIMSDEQKQLPKLPVSQDTIWRIMRGMLDQIDLLLTMQLWLYKRNSLRPEWQLRQHPR